MIAVRLKRQHIFYIFYHLESMSIIENVFRNKDINVAVQEGEGVVFVSPGKCDGNISLVFGTKLFFRTDVAELLALLQESRLKGEAA